MKKSSKKIASLLLLFIFLVQVVLADGGMWVHDSGGWKQMDETRQLCAINYEEGYQSMILSINFKADVKGDKAVWIFPVPADPDDTVVDIITGFPTFRGYDIKEKAKSTIKNKFEMMRTSQVYPALLMSRMLFLGQISSTKEFAAVSGRGREPSMYVYEHIEKMGITTELVRVKDGLVLQRYFEAKKLEIPSEARKIFDEYIGQDYLFVISWIYDIEKLKAAQQERTGYGVESLIGVSLTFPTDKVYFPLKPTAIYGSNIVPATIYVNGFATPELYDSIKPYTEIKYLYQGPYSVPEAVKPLFNGKSQITDFKYTEIQISPPSKYLKEDLFMKNSAPKDVQRAESLIKHAKTLGWFLFFIASILASLIAAFISFGKDTKPLKFLIVGLLNTFTLISVIIAAFIIKTKTVDVKLLKALKDQKIALTIWDKRKLLFVFLFSVIFLVIIFLLEKIVLSFL